MGPHAMGLLSLQKGETWTWSYPQREEAVKRYRARTATSRPRGGVPQAGGAEGPRPSPARGLPVSLLRRSLFAAFPLGLFLFLTDA